MPVDHKDIEVTKVVPSLLQKKQRDKFYTPEELFFMEYGLEFNEMAPDTEAVMWGWWWGINNLLASLVVQGKVTGTGKKKVTLPPKVYYGLPRGLIHEQ